MSDRNGRLVTALGGLAVVALTFAFATGVWFSVRPEEPHLIPDEQPQEVHAQYKSGGPGCATSEVAALKTPAEQRQKQSDCSDKARERSIQNHSLTQSAAALRAANEGVRMAYSQGVIGAIQAVLSVLAVAFTGWAAWAAARAARAAQESLDDARSDAEQQKSRFQSQIDLAQQAATSSAEAAAAMQSVAESMAINATQIVRSVGISEEISDRQKRLGETQLRAYVSVLIGGAFYQDDNYVFEANPVLQNIGNTPAHHLRWRIAADVLPVPLPDDFRFPLPPRDTTNRRSLLLPPQQTFEMRAIVGRRVPAEEALMTKLGFGKSLYVWGVVTYRDHFRRRRRTTFAQQIFWRPSGPAGADGRVPEIVRGSYLPHHNKAT